MGEHPLFISEVLPEHVRFVRAVARSLLDEHDAEDAVQDTLLRALERPPRPENIRGWLKVVVRNFALRRRREEQRRRSREMMQAPSDRMSPPGEVLARIEVQRRVLDAVRDLPEPYRSVIVHRYLDELTREQIAERLDLPLETVRTRLRRALRLLRRRLDRGDEGAHSWVAALLPILKSGPPAVVVGRTPPLAPLAAKIALAAAIVGSGALLFVSRSPVSGTARVVEGSPVYDAAGTQGGQGASASAVERPLFVSGVVRDVLGDVVPGALAVASGGNEQRTGTDGIFRLPVAEPGGRASVVVRKEGFLPWRGVLDALPGDTQPITLLRGVALSVVVHTEEGSPVAGALAKAHEREERGIAGMWWSRQLRPVGEDLSDARGRASLGAAPEGNVEIRVDAPRYAPWYKEIGVTTGSEPVVIEAVLSRGGGISGLVTDEAGNAVEGARVYSGSWPDRVALTGADGRYRLQLVGEGQNRVLAEADGFGIGFFGASLGWGRPVPVRVCAGRTVQDVDVVLPSAIEVLGHVIDEDDRPLPGVRVEALAGPCPGRPVATVTDGSGRFAIGAFAETDGRPIRLTLELEGYAIESVSVPSQPGVLDVGEIRARAHGGVRGHVLDADGQPLREGRVEVLPFGPTAVVGANGEFLLNGVPAGTARIRARAWNPARSGTASVLVEAGVVGTGVEIRVDGVLQIRGRVLSPDGEPRRGLSVAAVAEGGGREIAARAVTDVEGVFDLRDLSRGVYDVGILSTPLEQETTTPNTLVAYTNDVLAVHLVLPGTDSDEPEVRPVFREKPRPVRAVAGADNVRLVAPGCSTTVQGSVVSRLTGRPLNSFEVSFIEYWRGLIPRGSETLDVHDKAGTFRYQLAEGRWAVEVTAPGHATFRTQVFSAGSEVERDLGTIRLSSGGKLRGAVRDAGGDPVAYARVYLLGPQLQTNRKPIFTDAQGSYDGTSVTPGAYTVFVLSPSHPFAIVRNVRIGEEETSVLDVHLDRPSPVTVTVTDEAGEPVAGADVSYTCDALFPLTSRLLRSHEPPGWGGYLTDGSGRLRKEFLPAGRVLFSVKAPGFVPAKRVAELLPDCETSVDVRLVRKP